MKKTFISYRCPDADCPKHPSNTEGDPCKMVCYVIHLGGLSCVHVPITGYN